jgi:hypothetical protein
MVGSGWVGATAGRDRGGRFASGVSGNPAGRRKGTLNRMTKLSLALDADESGEIARVVIDRAKAGDHVAARFCLGLLVAKPRSRPIELDLPACNGLDGIVASFDVTVAAMADGEITPDEALTVTRVLDRRRRAIEALARQQERAARRGRQAAPLAVVASIAQPDDDLHSACKFGSPANEVPVAAGPAAALGETLAARDAPPRPPLPGFGAACIRPEIRRRGRDPQRCARPTIWSSRRPTARSTPGSTSGISKRAISARREGLPADYRIAHCCGRLPARLPSFDE